MIKKDVVIIIRKNIIFYAKINKKNQKWKLEELSRMKFFLFKISFSGKWKKN